jgi:hemerythrin superfamily protein
MSVHIQRTTFEKSLFESNDKTEQVKRLTTRSFDNAAAIDYRDAAKELLGFSIEKAVQFHAANEKALEYLVAMELKYLEQISEETTKHEKQVKELKKTFEVGIPRLC